MFDLIIRDGQVVTLEGQAKECRLQRHQPRLPHTHHGAIDETILKRDAGVP